VKPGAVLMTDGYELYNGIAHDHQLVHLGCWAHVRRGFIKAEENVPKAARSPELLATWFIVLIGRLFAAESRSTKWKRERRQMGARFLFHGVSPERGRSWASRRALMRARRRRFHG